MGESVAYRLSNAGCVYGFDTDDADWNTVSAIVGTVTVPRQTTRTQTGAGGGDVDLTTNGNKGVVRLIQVGNTQNTVITGYWSVDAAPSSEAAVIYGSTAGSAAGGKSYVTIGTDRKVRFYDKNANLVGSASTTLVPTAGLQQFTIEYNCLTLSTVWITLWLAETEELSFDTGLSLANFFTNGDWLFFGEHLGAFNRGCHIYFDDLVPLITGTEADSGYATAIPIPHIYGNGNPDTGTAGTGDWPAGEWNEGTGSTFAEVDNSELGTHDSDTSYLQSTVTGEEFYLSTTSANPLPDPCTVLGAVQRIVHRATGGDKTVGTAVFKLGGTKGADTYIVAPPTTYVGNMCGAIREPTSADSQAWVRADADASTLQWGGETTSGGTAGERVTLMLGPNWVIYDDTLPLSTAPTTASGERRRLGAVI